MLRGESAGRSTAAERGARLRRRMRRRLPAIVSGLGVLLLVFGIAVGTTDPSQPGRGGFPLPSLAQLRSTAASVLGLGSNTTVAVPGQGSGTSVGAHSTRAGTGSGKAPGKGTGQLPPAGDGAPKPTPGKSGKVYTGYNAKTSVIDQSRTTSTDTWYRNADGSESQKSSTGLVNYKDSAGQWKTIDSSLVSTGSAAAGRTGWSNAANSFSLKLAASAGPQTRAEADALTAVSSSASPSPSATTSMSASGDPATADPASPIVEFSLGSGESFGWGLSGESGSTGTAQGDLVVYPDALPSVDLAETSEPYGVMEDLLLHSADAPGSYTFPLTLDGVSVRTSDDGGAELVDSSGAVVATFGAPWAQDSSQGPGGTANPASMVRLSYGVETLPGGGQALTVSLPADYLTDPARVFPVTLDPQVYLNGPGDDLSTFTDTACTVSCAANHNDGYTQVIGDWSDFTAVSLLKLNTNGFLKSGWQVSSAQFGAFMYINGDTATQDYYVEPINSTWSWSPGGANVWPSNFSSIASGYIGEFTGDTKADSCAINGTTKSGDWTYADLNAGYLDDWALGATYNGLTMVPSNWGPDGTDEQFASTLQGGCAPYVLINYTPDQPATISSYAPPSGTSLSALTPTLSASETDADPYPSSAGVTTGWHFQVAGDGNGDLADSGKTYQASSSWTVPAGKLKWGHTYSWVVCYFDGFQCNSPTWYTFTTTAPPPVLGGTLSQDTNGHGFNAATGGYSTSTTDAQIAGVGPAIEVSRAYNSLYPYASGGFGDGWSTETDAQVQQILDPAGNLTEAVVTYTDGEQVAFAANADGSYAPPEGRYATLTYASGTGYTLTDKTGTVYVFDQTITAPVTGQTAANVAGQFGITRIADHAGRALTFTWSASTAGHIVSEQSPITGRSLTFTWFTPQNAKFPHIQTATTNDATSGEAWTAQQWTYGYKGDELVTVCAPLEQTPTSGNAQSSAACTGYSYKDQNVYQQAVLNAAAYEYWPLGDPVSASTAQSLIYANYASGQITYSNVQTGVADSPLANSTATVAKFNGSSSVATLPSGLIGDSAQQTVSLWFRTSTPNAVLLGISAQALSAGAATKYTPTLAIGKDGKLLGEFWNGSANQIESGSPVDDGAWHNVVLSANGSSGQALYLDGAPITSNTTAVVPQTGLIGTLGAGYYSGCYLDTALTGCTAGPQYFSGEISDFSVYQLGLTAAQVSQLYQIGHVGTPLLNLATRPNLHDDSNEAPAAHITYDSVSGRTSSVTDGNGGTWTIDAPTAAATSYIYRSTVAGLGPWHEWSLDDPAGSSAASDAVQDDASSSSAGIAQYNDLTLGTDAGVFIGWTAGKFTAASSSYLELPSNMLNGMTAGTVGLWFKTTATDAVLLGTAAAPITNGTVANGYTPMLYIGTDGKLYSSFFAWPGHQIHTSAAVNDGNWHFVVLATGAAGSTSVPLQVCPSQNATAALSPSPTSSATGTPAPPSPSPCPDQSASPSSSSSSGATAQTALYLDGQQIGTDAQAVAASPDQTYGFVGAGFTGGTWPAESHTSTTSNTGYAEYFTGDISDVAVFPQALSAGDVSDLWSAAWKNQQAGSYNTRETVDVVQPADTASNAAATSEYDYDPANGMRLVRSVDGLGRSTTYGYDTGGYLAVTRDPLGDQRIQGHDARGNVVSTSTCQNTAQQQCETAYSNYYLDPNSSTDPRNDLVATSSDSRSASASDTTYQTDYSYDTDGDLLVTRDPLGRETVDTYTDGSSAYPSCDQAGKNAPPGLLATTTAPGGATTRYTYRADGDTCTAMNALGQVTYFQYDQLGRVTGKTVGHQLVASWPLTQTTGTSIADGSGLGDTGTAQNVSWSGGAATLNGTSSEIAANSPVINTAASYSVSAWVDLTSLPTDYSIVATVPGRHNNAMSLLYNPASTSWVFQTTAQDVDYTTETYYSAVSPTAITSGTWYHLVGVYNASSGTDTLYVNGAVAATAPAPKSWVAGGDFAVGTSTEGQYFLPGQVASIQAYQRALTPTEVDTLFGEGRAGAPVTEPVGADETTIFTYDGDGRIATQQAPETVDQVTSAGHTALTSYTYDDDGNVTAETVSDLTGGDFSRTTTDQYNDEDQLWISTAPEGSRSTNAAGAAIPANQDGQNHTTTYTYDQYGHVYQETDAQNRVTQTLYDADGDKTELDALNTDEHGMPASGSTLIESTWTYDKAGRLSTQVDDKNGLDYTTEYSYYDDNQTYEVTRTDGNGLTYIEARYFYDGTGDVTKELTNNLALETDTVYDPDKRATTVTVDPLGQDKVTTISYNDAGNVAENKITGKQMTAPGTWGTGVLSDVTYTYDAAGEMLTQTAVDGSTSRTTTWTRDWRGLATAVSDPSGQTTYTTYDAAGRAVLAQQPSITATTLDPVTGTVTSAASVPVTETGYDTYGDTVETVDPDGNESKASYDADGLEVSSTGPAYTQQSPTGSGATYTPTVTTAYDGDGEPIATWDPIANASIVGDNPPTAGETTTTQYTNLGQPYRTTATDIAHSTSQTASGTYDALGRQTSATDPQRSAEQATQPNLPATTSTVYDALNRPTSTTTTDTLGGAADNTLEAETTTYAYQASSTDPGGSWPSAVTTPAVGYQSSAPDVTTGYGYDNLGEQLTSSVTSPTGTLTTTATYDGAGRTAQVLAPDGDVTDTVYDEGGLATQTGLYNGAGGGATELSGSQTTYTLNGQPYQATVLRTDGTRQVADGSTTSTYNAATTTTYGYGPTGLLTSQKQQVDANSADDITVSFGYNLDGQETSYTSGNGNTTYTAYNPWGQTSASLEPPASGTGYTYNSLGDEESIDWYDEDGNLAEQVLPGNVTISATYNALGELVGQSGSAPAAATATRTFSYTPDGLVMGTSTTAAGNQGSTTETFGYDDRGLLISTGGDGGTSGFAYAPDGQTATRTDASGTSQYTYNEAGQLATDQDAASQATGTYAYNTAGQLTQIAYTGGATRSFGYTTSGQVQTDTVKSSGGTVLGQLTYGYDLAGELTSSTDASGATNNYTYDQAGRLVEWKNTPQGSGTTATTDYAYDKDSNRTQVGTSQYSYDTRDELQSGSGSTYTYTAAGTVAAITQGSTTTAYTYDAYGQQVGVGAAGTYTYDASGRLISESNGSTALGFAYSGAANTLAQAGNQVFSRDPQGVLIGQNTTTYALTGTSTATPTSTGTGSEGESTPGVLLWANAHTDVVGAYTGSGTVLTGTETYSPLGQVTGSTGVMPQISVGFQSEYTDAATGNVDMAARWYDPASGQFLSKDTTATSPTPNSANANPFAYADGDPLTYTDPTGHMVDCPGGPCGNPGGYNIMTHHYSPQLALQQLQWEVRNDQASIAAMQQIVARGSKSALVHDKPVQIGVVTVPSDYMSAGQMAKLQAQYNSMLTKVNAQLSATHGYDKPNGPQAQFEALAYVCESSNICDSSTGSDTLYADMMQVHDDTSEKAVGPGGPVGLPIEGVGGGTGAGSLETLTTVDSGLGSGSEMQALEARESSTGKAPSVDDVVSAASGDKISEDLSDQSETDYKSAEQKVEEGKNAEQDLAEVTQEEKTVEQQIEQESQSTTTKPGKTNIGNNNDSAGSTKPAPETNVEAQTEAASKPAAASAPTADATDAAAMPPTEEGGAAIEDAAAPRGGDLNNPPASNAAPDEINWPPNRGALGDSQPTTLEPGTLIDRYGRDGGTFVSPAGTDFGMRALPPGTKSSPYSIFVVTAPIVTQEATIAPWFGQPGLGLQYELPAPVSDLLGKSIERLYSDGGIK